MPRSTTCLGLTQVVHHDDRATHDDVNIKNILSQVDRIQTICDQYYECRERGDMIAYIQRRTGAEQHEYSHKQKQDDRVIPVLETFQYAQCPDESEYAEKTFQQQSGAVIKAVLPKTVEVRERAEERRTAVDYPAHYTRTAATLHSGIGHKVDVGHRDASQLVHDIFERCQKYHTGYDRQQKYAASVARRRNQTCDECQAEHDTDSEAEEIGRGDKEQRQ